MKRRVVYLEAEGIDHDYRSVRAFALILLVAVAAWVFIPVVLLIVWVTR